MNIRFTKFLKNENGGTPFERLLNLFLQMLTYTKGDAAEALDWLNELDREHGITNEEYGMGDFIEDLKKKGYLKENPVNGNFDITGKSTQVIRKKALEEIFGKLRKAGAGQHKTFHSGTGDELTSDSRAYQFGDSIDTINLTSSIHNAQVNHGIDEFNLTEDDLVITEREHKTQTSTVLMIDISHSMILYGEDRITPAKKVAMAFSELIMTRYPKDTLDVLVFGDDAYPIEVKDLPFLQVGPFHTNTVAGLELAMEMLRKRKAINKQIFMITDGKPSCLKQGDRYYKNSFGLDRIIVNKCYNLSAQCKRLKIPITTFMIASDNYLQEFVREFTEINNGRAFYCAPDDLGEIMFVDYEKKTERRTYDNMNIEKIKTLGDLKKSGYKSKTVKEELRDNLIIAIKEKKNYFEEIKGYDETVLPQLHHAILSKHNIILLGLRGQAKTRVARLMVNLLDEFIPVVDGSELNDDPMNPISRQAKDIIAEMKDATPVRWMIRDERYTEKLATPDVSVADLIGDVDPIKAATLKLAYADERVIHYGLIPRSHRCIFVINELPDLQARIQVALFNILQEGDVQVRGYKMRLPLDIQFVFTANPEDYTNRGSIVTPLKDRIGSQILTHYPKSVEISEAITQQEAKIADAQKQNILIPQLLRELIEQIAIEARDSDWIDKKSGVSARLTISALENLYSVVERRLLLTGETKGSARVSDIYGIISSITGKVELVYEGELEGMSSVAQQLIGKAMRTLFLKYFPNPEKTKKSKQVANPFAAIINWFNEANTVDILSVSTTPVFEKEIVRVSGLHEMVKNLFPKAAREEQLVLMEFCLHGLAEYSQLSKHRLENNFQFKDLLGNMFSFSQEEKN